MAKVNGLKLLSVGNNAKTIKGDGSEYLTAILYLAPADLVDGINLCPMAVLAGCKAGCLYSAGRGRMNSVQAARTRKTIFWRDHRDLFLDQLEQDLDRFLAYCQRKGIQACVRLNGTSDIPWENYLDMAGRYSAIQFYDYTKTVNRINKPLPKNYHLTLSYSEASARYADMVLDAMQNNTGQNMAVVFRDKDSIPPIFHGYPVIDGDKDDLRFLDKRGSVVALYAKGQAKQDQSGFVIN
jgi:hypothetical protein